jgi:hypothetical protein
LNILAEWCEANALELNIGKCKSITFSRLRHPIEFSYMLGGNILDRVDSINDLEVIMDSKMSFTGHIDDPVGMALAMLGFVKRLSFEFRDPHTLKTLYVSLVRPKLQYASCVWRTFYGAHIDRIERVQRKFVRYELRGLGWTDMCDLLPYVDRCALIRLKTLTERHANACAMLIFDILSGRVYSSNLLSLISINALWYHTRTSDFLRVDFHRTNYGVHDPLNSAVWSFNEFAGLIDFHLSRNQFFNRLRSVL